MRSVHGTPCRRGSAIYCSAICYSQFAMMGSRDRLPTEIGFLDEERSGLLPQQECHQRRGQGRVSAGSYSRSFSFSDCGGSSKLAFKCTMRESSMWAVASLIWSARTKKDFEQGRLSKSRSSVSCPPCKQCSLDLGYLSYCMKISASRGLQGLLSKDWPGTLDCRV